MRSFISKDKFEIPFRGVMYTTVADKEMSRENPDIVGEIILLNGDKVKVLSVNSFQGPGIIHIGEKIGLLI